MRYLLIDKIKKIECNEHISAIKNVAMSEDVFRDHFAGCPVMPGALLIESAAQAATALIEVSADFRVKAILSIVDKAKFRKLVRPGDQLLINVKMISMQSDSAMLDCIITVNDKPVMDGRLVFNLMDSEKFYPLKGRIFIESIYDYWLEGAELTGFDSGKENGHE
jgi:3-hydroxymyristoyl/3-hydroxydecanoyl-(acyl carrier protein) dehydratase